jgi:hypothetical protein
MLLGKPKPKDYLSNISALFEGLGIKRDSQRRFNSTDDDRLVVYLATPGGRQYDINFWMNGEGLVYESVVKKAFTGKAESVAVFYQTLLGYNAAMSKLNFALVSSDNGWLLLLQGETEYKNVDAKFLYDLVKYYEFAYSKHVEAIEDLADELQLKPRGNLDRVIQSFLDRIL